MQRSHTDTTAGRSLPGRIATGLGVGAAALAATIATTGPAQAADDDAKACGSVAIEWSVDAGKTWSRAGLLGSLATKVDVRVAGNVAKSCTYKVTLAAYSADGPTWKTSGVQRYLGSRTASLTGAHRGAALDISRYAPPCFGQIDLYGNDKIFDGKANPLPRYPDAKFPTDLIAGWNGGKECAPSSPKPSTKPPTTTPPTTVPPTTAVPSTTTSTSKPPSPSASASASSTHAPDRTATPTSASTPPDDQRTPPASGDVPGQLAQTGASDGVLRIAGASAAVLISGVGALLLIGRRPRRRGPHRPGTAR
ncbi:LAETG motif-containing sortase-dependent surface protein [Embleya sp. MST-111070]|uniref:LAETG motif-containing sortase-dependent surface protein n=1 Tax=Embleya sp. MST-111070 TaxID=3398231 RepID=UPI003F736662